MYEVLINLMYENLFFTCTKFILVSVRKFIFLLLDFLFFLFTNFFVRTLRKISGKGVFSQRKDNVKDTMQGDSGPGICPT